MMLGDKIRATWNGRDVVGYKWRDYGLWMLSGMEVEVGRLM